LRTAKELGRLMRVIPGTDGPAGSGAQPLDSVRMIAMLSSFGEMPAETFFVSRPAAPRAWTRRNIQPARNSSTAFSLATYTASPWSSSDGIVRRSRSRNIQPEEQTSVLIK
jgi:enamidase